MLPDKIEFRNVFRIGRSTHTALKIRTTTCHPYTSSTHICMFLIYSNTMTLFLAPSCVAQYVEFCHASECSFCLNGILGTSERKLFFKFMHAFSSTFSSRRLVQMSCNSCRHRLIIFSKSSHSWLSHPAVVAEHTCGASLSSSSPVKSRSSPIRSDMATCRYLI